MLALLLAPSLSYGMAPPVAPHGGPKPNGPSGAPTVLPGVPTPGPGSVQPNGPAGRPRAGAARSSPVTAAGTPVTSTASRGTRGTSGRSGVASASTQQAAVPTLEGWEPWWNQNKDRFLKLRDQLGRSQNVSGSPGLLTGRGRKLAWRNSRRVDPDMVEELIMPVLLSVLANSDHSEILDSTVLALARSAPAHRAADVLAATIPLLSHEALSVQTSAALSLGVLGSRQASTLLLSLARDDSTGRMAIGGGPVPRQIRAHSAFALGLVADSRSIYSMLQLITRLPASERDIKASALAGLGMLPADHTQLDVIETVLVDLLGDQRLAPFVASYIPTTLAKLGRRTALPALLSALNNRDSSHPLRQSVVLAAGRLATLQDTTIYDTLVAEVSEGKDRLTRHFAIISLAQMGANTPWGETHADLSRLLGRELQGAGKSQEHRSWAALAVALVGRAHPDAQPLILDRLREAYLSERAPSYKGAYALALGLLGDSHSAEAIHDDFIDVADQGFQGHAALALGFLQYIDCSDRLRDHCLNNSSSDALRIASASSLGLLGDTSSVPTLVDALKDTGSLSTRAALAKAVGLIGDRSAVEPLLELVSNPEQPPLSRAFAAVAVGLLAERTSLPFNEPLKADGNYIVPVDSVQELLAIL
ncbi:MAG: HEAT repeat protein [Pseudohongiellaceae bacterium]|jgi:HEAT repeat protein